MKKDRKTQHTIQLIQGEFTPSQASHLVLSLLNQKINYHELEGIKLWERNHNSDPEPVNKRIKELEKERKVAQEFISRIRRDDKNVKINGVIEMYVLDSITPYPKPEI